MLWRGDGLSLRYSPCSLIWAFKWRTYCFCMYIYFSGRGKATSNSQALWADCCSLHDVILGRPQIGATRVVVHTPKYNKVVVVFFSFCLHAEGTREICGGTDYPEQFVLSTSLFHFSAMCCKNQKVPFLPQNAEGRETNVARRSQWNRGPWLFQGLQSETRTWNPHINQICFMAHLNFW